MHRQRAFIVHRTTNRMRVKIPGERHNTAFFARLQRQLAQHGGIVAVETNPLTASVLIFHRDGFGPGDIDATLSSRPERSGELGSRDEKGALFVRRSRVHRCAMPRDDGGVLRSPGMAAHLDNCVRTLSGGDVDLRSLVLKIAVAAITRQSVWQVLTWFAETVLRAAFKSLMARAGRIRLSEDDRLEPVLLAAA